jgi:hypothetical protein
MRRVFNRNSKLILRIAGGSVSLWSADIFVFDRKGNVAAVFYEGDHFYYEDEGRAGYFRGWIGDVSKSDLISELGYFIRQLPDEMRFGGAQVISDHFGRWAIDFLKMCFEPESVDEANIANLLCCFTSREIQKIFELLGGYKNDLLIGLAEDAWEYCGGGPVECNLYGKLIDLLGSPDSVGWFKKAADFLRKEVKLIESSRARLEAKRHAQSEKRFGSVDLVSNVSALRERFGHSIPAGFLSHATSFLRPEADDEALSLLLAWGTIDKALPQLPSHLDRRSVRMSLNPDIQFLRWLLDAREANVLYLVQQLPIETKMPIVEKLRQLGKECKNQLERLAGEKPTSQAHYVIIHAERSEAEYGKHLLEFAERIICN